MKSAAGHANTRWATRRVASLLGLTTAIAALAGVAGQARADRGNAPDDALAWASYSKAEVWLEHSATDRKQRELVFEASPDVEPRVLGVNVPPGVSSEREDVALGRDAGGALTVVVQSQLGLYWTHVNGPRLHRVPGTSGRDGLPSIFRGQLAYEHWRHDEGSVVRLGSLIDGRTRTLWSNLSDPQHTRTADQTAVGAGNTVAIVTRRNDAGASAYRALLTRLGHKTRQLMNLGLDDTHSGSLWIQTSPSGRRLMLRRDVDRTTTTIRYALPGGSKLSSDS